MAASTPSNLDICLKSVDTRVVNHRHGSKGDHEHGLNEVIDVMQERLPHEVQARKHKAEDSHPGLGEQRVLLGTHIRGIRATNKAMMKIRLDTLKASTPELDRTTQRSKDSSPNLILSEFGSYLP